MNDNAAASSPMKGTNYPKNQQYKCVIDAKHCPRRIFPPGDRFYPNTKKLTISPKLYIALFPPEICPRHPISPPSAATCPSLPNSPFRLIFQTLLSTYWLTFTQFQVKNSPDTSHGAHFSLIYDLLLTVKAKDVSWSYLFHHTRGLLVSMMDALELPLPVDVEAPPKLIVSEGLVRTGAAVNEVDGPGSNPLSIIVGHSIECRSSRHDGIGEWLIDYTWLSSKSC